MLGTHLQQVWCVHAKRGLRNKNTHFEDSQQAFGKDLVDSNAIDFAAC